MMTTVPKPESDPVAVGPPPPFDPELTDALATTLDVIPERMPETCPRRWQPAGEPDVSLAVCVPAKETNSWGSRLACRSVAPGAPADAPGTVLQVTGVGVANASSCSVEDLDVLLFRRRSVR
jgi:hypothetical protein